MGKRARLWKLIQDIRASYWFLPSVLVVFALLLASLTEWIDHNPGVLPIQLPASFLDTQADGARSTLAVISQSIIGVTGVTFSMTLVAVSFASGNFGPRLIGNFMRDRGNQWSFGILISTFVYALVVLRSVQDGLEDGADQFVPQYSILIALLLTLLCVFTLIHFIHHVPETINVSQISAGLGKRLETDIRSRIDAQRESSGSRKWPDAAPDCSITSSMSGYVQTCNLKTLCGLADDNKWHIEMAPSVGTFVTTQTVIFKIWSKTPLTDSDKNKINGCFAVGSSRTENQNPAFMAEQLVEMAARALSPGVNDPYTAMDCLNRLAAALTVAATYKGGLDPRPHPLVRIPALTFETLFEVGFPLCRQYVRPDDITRHHALALLETLQTNVRTRDHAIVRAEITALKVDA